MLKRGGWSVEDLTRLKEQYGRRPLGQLARDLRRTPDTVRQRALQMFAGRLRVGELTSDETHLLRRMVGIADLEAMCLVLGRQEGNVLRVLHGWAETRRSGRFQSWENDYLKSCYSSRPDWAVALVLGRSMAAIRRRARELCLGKDRRIAAVALPALERVVVVKPQPRVRMPRWTDTEIRQLVALYPSTPNLELARALGRSVKSVIAKANELGLKKSVARLRTMGRENVRNRHRG